MSGERPDLTTGRDIPKLERAISASRQSGTAVRRNRNRSHVTRMPGECPNLTTGRDIPKLERLILASRQRGTSVRRKRDRGHVTRMSGEGPDRATGRDIPKPERLATTRQSGASIRRKRDRIHVTRMSGECPDLTTGRDIPKLERAISASRQSGASIRRKRNREHRTRMSGERPDLTTGRLCRDDGRRRWRGRRLRLVGPIDRHSEPIEIQRVSGDIPQTRIVDRHLELFDVVGVIRSGILANGDALNVNPLPVRIGELYGSAACIPRAFSDFLAAMLDPIV